MYVIIFFVLVIAGYLFGSLCSAIVVSRVFELPDPCTEGSNNPGATNVLRLAGKKYAAIVMFVDVLKGTIPVLIGHLLHAGPFALGFISLAAVIGHVYPVFFGFKGGKGVATALGTFFGINLILGTLCAAVWLIVAGISRYSSLASMAMMVFAPLMAIVAVRDVNIFIPLFVMTLLVLYEHRHNISRVIDGVEPKINLKPKKEGD